MNKDYYILYNDIERNKEYKLYYNDVDLTVLIDDGTTKHVIRFSHEEPIYNVISRFESKLSPEEKEVDVFLARFKGGK